MAARSPFSPADLALLSCYLPAISLRDRLLLRLGLEAGFRARELASLTLRHVVAPDGVVLRSVTLARRFLKGGRGPRRRSVRSRTVPLSDSLRGLIQEWYHVRQHQQADLDSPLFPSRFRGRAIGALRVNRLVQMHAHAAGISTPNLGSHSLRKTFANRVYAATGHDIVVTQQALGHASITSTVAYLRPADSAATAAILAAAQFP